MGVHELYFGIIADKRHNNAQRLACSFSAQVPASLPPVVQSVARKVDYSQQIWQRVRYLDGEELGECR